jgi:hypothetical protein
MLKSEVIFMRGRADTKKGKIIDLWNFGTYT